MASAKSAQVREPLTELTELESDRTAPDGRERCELKRRLPVEETPLKMRLKIDRTEGRAWRVGVEPPPDMDGSPDPPTEQPADDDDDDSAHASPSSAQDPPPVRFLEGERVRATDGKEGRVCPDPTAEGYYRLQNADGTIDQGKRYRGTELTRCTFDEHADLPSGFVAAPDTLHGRAVEVYWLEGDGSLEEGSWERGRLVRPVSTAHNRGWFTLIYDDTEGLDPEQMFVAMPSSAAPAEGEACQPFFAARPDGELLVPGKDMRILDHQSASVKEKARPAPDPEEEVDVDSKLWPGAAAAGWTLKAAAQSHYTYYSPDGRKFTSRKAALEAGDATGPGFEQIKAAAREAKAAEREAKAAEREAAKAAKAEKEAAAAAAAANQRVELNSIDKVLDSRARDPAAKHDAEAVEQFLCKFKGIAYVHSRWLTVDEIADDGRMSIQKMKNFKNKLSAGSPLEPYPAYMEVERVIAAYSGKEADAASPPAWQPELGADDSDDDAGAAEGEDGEDDEDGEDGEEVADAAAEDGEEGEEKEARDSAEPMSVDAQPGGEQELWLVKWRGLGYDQCTWEDAAIAGEKHIAAYRQRAATVAARTSGGADASPKGASSTDDVPETFTEGRPPVAGGRALRDYQRDGVRWLRYNYTQGRSVMLGDEMGLGKTAQSAQMLHCLHALHGVRDPFLLVVPLSTLQHWQRELNAWTTLHSVVFHGSKEARDVLMQYEWVGAAKGPRRGGRGSGWSGAAVAQPRFDACITTYETLVNCADIFRKVKRWGYLVLDEAHRLKNKEGQALGVIKSLQIEHKLALTGTPLQNNIGELWSILNLLDPAKFDDLDQFEEQYGDMHSAEQVAALTASLRTYLLRRTKEDVDLGLQPMLDTLISVDITNFQKQCYKAILEQNRTLLFKGAEGVTGPSFNNVAMQLRHCCNHPFLIKGIVQAEGLEHAEDATWLERLVQSSGKLALLDKLLPKLQKQGHRVLVFSQFKMLLDLIEDYVRLREYEYERLDGSVTGEARQAAIDRFSEPESTKFLFLLGTRAGGVGINLVAADTVIIYDPDWNPQNDIQAQARCHRIGQTKTVNVYRLVTRDTYEMHLYERANHKLGLEQAVIGQGGYHKAGGKDGDKKDAAAAASAMKLKATEIEELLKHGANKLFTEEHDAQIERFGAESIEQILERCATTTQVDPSATAKAGGGKNVFSKASFVAEDGTEQMDMNDPNFWQKVLGEEEKALNGDDDDGMMGERRRRAAPERFDPRWDSALSAAPRGADGGGAAACGAVNPQNPWTRAQLQALFAGLLAHGYGRPEALVEHVAALGARTTDELAEATDYTVAIALQHTKPAKGKDAAADPADDGYIDDEVDDPQARQEHVARVWHYLQSGAPPPPSTGALLAAPRRAQMQTRGDSSWYATRVRTKAKNIVAQLVDLRRLRAAIETAFSAPPPEAAPAEEDASAFGPFSAPALGPRATRPTFFGSTTREWGAAEDTQLLLGVHAHGYSAYDEIFADASLTALHGLALKKDAPAPAAASSSSAAASTTGTAAVVDIDGSDDDEAPAPAPAPMEVEPEAGAAPDAVSVEARALNRRLKALLNALPIASADGAAAPTPMETDDGAAAGGGGGGGTGGSSAAEAFVLSLYPAGVDRKAPSEISAMVTALDDKDGAKEAAAEARRAAAAAERAERAAMTAEAREAHRLQKMEAKAQLAAAKEKEKQAKLDAKAAEKAEAERRKREEKEARERERVAKQDEKDRAYIEKLMSYWMEKVEKMAEQDAKDEEKAEKKRAREEEKARAEAEAEARKAEREAEKARKAEEAERDKAMRHMLKVRQYEERRVVHVALSVGAIAGSSSARVPGGGGPVSLSFSFPDKVVGATRLHDGLERIMYEYDWTNKSEAFKKDHRWMQMLDSVELGLQRSVGELYAVRSSMGCGGWAKVPWIAVSHPTESTQHGLYLQYLFRADMSGVYLCLGQGTTKLKAAFGQTAANQHLAHVGEFVRAKCKELLGEDGGAAGFDLTGKKIDLRTVGAASLADSYEKGAIVSKLYERGEVPSEDDLLEGLQLMLGAYAAVLADPQYIAEIKEPSDARLAAAGAAPGGGKKGRVSLGTPGGAGIKRSGGQARARAREEGAEAGGDEGGGGGGGTPGEDGAQGERRVRQRRMSAGEKRKEKQQAEFAQLQLDLPLGMKVEVLQRDDGYQGSWYEGEVAKHVFPDKCSVRYFELLEVDDDAPSGAEPAKLVGEEPAKYLRPLPPAASVSEHAAWLATLKPGDDVELSYDSGWWDMAVEAVSDDRASFTVASRRFAVEHTVGGERLRQPRVWDPDSKAWAAAGEANDGGFLEDMDDEEE